VVIRPKPWLYVLVRGYTNRSSSDASTSYKENPRAGYVAHTVVIDSYPGYAWLYAVIYCNCNKKESEPHSDIQGRPPFIMTSATRLKYSRPWIYVVIIPEPWLYVLVRGYTSCTSPRVLTSYQKKTRGGCVSLVIVSRRGYASLYTATVCVWAVARC